MSGERGRLRIVGQQDPIWQLWAALPIEWRGPVIGADVENWDAISENDERRLNLGGLPDVIAAEMAWMAHWQAQDGTRSSVLALNQLANILRRAITHGHPFPDSIRLMDWDTACALQGWFYATRWKRLPPKGSRARLRVVFRFARLALIAACHPGPWWDLDDWHPRCDPRIPLTDREPLANYGSALEKPTSRSGSASNHPRRLLGPVRHREQLDHPPRRRPPRRPPRRRTRQDPPYQAPHHRRGRLHPLRSRSREPVLPARLHPLRTRLAHRHQQQTLRTVGRGLRRRRRRRRHDRPPRPPRRSHLPERRQLPTQRPRPRPHPQRPTNDQ